VEAAEKLPKIVLSKTPHTKAELIKLELVLATLFSEQDP
jgi:hypothetical protein